MDFDDNIIEQQDQFVQHILALAANFDFSVTSWGRTPEHNKTVGGVANSQHLTFLAVDIVPDKRQDWTSITTSAQDMHLVVIPENDHIHIQWPRE